MRGALVVKNVRMSLRFLRARVSSISIPFRLASRSGQCRHSIVMARNAGGLLAEPWGDVGDFRQTPRQRHAWIADAPGRGRSDVFLARAVASLGPASFEQLDLCAVAFVDRPVER